MKPILLALLLASLQTIAPAADPGVGELDIRDVLPLTAPQREKLAQLATTDPEARALFSTRLREAEAALEKMPRPLAAIRYEGLVNTDPRRVADVKNLTDMDTVAALFEAWQVTGDARFAAQCRRYLLGWATTYRPTGNDVNENKLTPLFVSYVALRDEFAPEERRTIDAWVTEIVAKQQAEQKKRPPGELTNRYTKRLRLIATAGLALDRPEWLAEAWEGFHQFVAQSLRADGTSLDLERRDTLTYHASSLRPLLDLAILAERRGEKLYPWTAPSGGSLKKSVDYVVPYAAGEKERREWTNSKVDLDRRRAAAGLEHYRAGRLYEPRQALELLEQAAYFDPTLLPLVIKLSGGKATRFPTWRTVLNEACRTP